MDWQLTKSLSNKLVSCDFCLQAPVYVDVNLNKRNKNAASKVFHSGTDQRKPPVGVVILHQCSTTLNHWITTSLELMRHRALFLKIWWVSTVATVGWRGATRQMTLNFIFFFTLRSHQALPCHHRFAAASHSSCAVACGDPVTVEGLSSSQTGRQSEALVAKAGNCNCTAWESSPSRMHNVLSMKQYVFEKEYALYTWY